MEGVAKAVHPHEIREFRVEVMTATRASAMSNTDAGGSIAVPSGLLHSGPRLHAASM